MKNPTKIFIDAEYLKLVPRMSPDQREALKESIREKGLLQPLEVSRRSGKVLDGMTRFDICEELRIIPTYTFKDFPTDEEEKEYAIIVNLKRRQLNVFQQIELMQTLRRDFNKQKRVEANQYMSKLKRGEITEKITKEDQLKNTTGYKMAEIINVGTTTIDKSNYIIDHGTTKDIESARSGAETITSAVSYTHLTLPTNREV